MTALSQFQSCFRACPLVAIIRGVEPEECEDIGAALIEAGIRIIEVPLNSPRPFDSIARLASRFGDKALIGAGTVLTPDDVGRVANAGGRLIVSPNTDPAVIGATVASDMVSAPGFFTPSEAFAAIASGAHAVKLFPAEIAGPKAVKALRAVLPREMPLLVVGGVRPDDMAAHFAAGANGFGLGGALYNAGDSATDVADRATAFIAALKAHAA